LASRLFFNTEENRDGTLGLLNSKLFKYFAKSFINHGVHVEVDDVKQINCHSQYSNLIAPVRRLCIKQKSDANYDYASNEQLEIDKLVYEAYGLNDADIREVEDWYVRRYP